MDVSGFDTLSVLRSEWIVCALVFTLVLHYAYYLLLDSGVHFEKLILEIGAHHVYPGFLSWS